MAGLFQLIGGSGARARVTKSGELVVAPLSYDLVANQTLDAANEAENFFAPKSQRQFVITTILLNSDKSVTTDVVIDVYEADSLTSTTIDKAILHAELLKNDQRDITGLRLLVSAGAFVNAKADDANVNVTIMGYFVKELAIELKA